MGVSTIPAFKATFVSRLQADASIVASGATVSYGSPYPGDPPDEWIWLGSTQTADEQAAALGQLHREEHYTLEVLIAKRADARATQQSVTERAFVLAGYVENSLRTWGASGAPDPFTYSVTGIRIAQVSAVDHSEGLYANKRVCVVNMLVAVQARI